MTVEEYLKHSTNILAEADIPTARLDSLILIEEVLTVDRAKLLVEPELKITQNQKIVLNELIAKRAKHIPIAQLIKRVEFYGRDFAINASVLVPRPESEAIIDELNMIIRDDPSLGPRYTKSKSTTTVLLTLKALRKDPNSIKIIDVGTGSGALGITAKLELGNVVVDLVDIDQEALEIAKTNVVLHTIDISTTKANLLPDNGVSYDIILANLPYVPDDYVINEDAKYEPRIAIFGGTDGLDLYRRLFNMLQKIHHRPLYILIEALPVSHNEAVSIAESVDYKLLRKNDFVLVFKSSSSSDK